MIKVVHTPPLNTVQDRGRYGHRRYGVGCAGAMDTLALAAGNAAIGNALDLAGIEFQLFPVTLRFDADAVIAITGADCSPKLDDLSLPPWWAVSVTAGQTLVLSAPLTGARSYLTVAGGIDVPVILGSRSTQIRDGFGGFNGRALINGDKLLIGTHIPFAFRDAAGCGIEPPECVFERLHHPWANTDDIILRVIPASEYEQFDETSRHRFKTSSWAVTVQSNRMGYRLSGEPLNLVNPIEMRSQGIVAGIVQVPPSGDPIIQLSDANSAGGYPKIAVVITCDLWKLAQATPGRALRFLRVSLSGARAARAEQAIYLDNVARMSGYCRVGAAS